MVRLPPKTLKVIGDFFRSEEPPTAKIADLDRQADQLFAELTLNDDDVVLCPEVFFDGVRVQFYSSLPPHLRSRCCFIVYDLLPLTHPQYFKAGTPHEIICKYFFLLRSIGHLAFISKATQTTFYERFMRNPYPPGRVIHLGSNGLGERVVSSPSERILPKFVVVGTIEPRKNHLLVLDAFECVVRRHPEVQLMFLGGFGWIEPAAHNRIHECQVKYSQLTVRADVSDKSIKEAVISARASIFVSAVEGFGLPPVESLWLGTPVIASAGMPSLEDLDDRGIHTVDPLDADGLAKGMIQFLDDSYCDAKRKEAMTLDLPDWKMFALEVADWVNGIHRSR